MKIPSSFDMSICYVKYYILIPFFFLQLFNSNIYSQTIPWKNEYITISDVGYNSIVLSNNFDNNIKIKIYKRENLQDSYLIPPRKTKRIYYSTNEFSEDFIRQHMSIVVYDDECYNADITRLNKIANNRYQKKQEEYNRRLIWRIAATAAENLGGDDSWSKTIGKAGNRYLDYLEFKEGVEINGFTDTSLDFLKSELKNKVIDEVVENKYLNTMTKGLDQLYAYQNKNITVNTADLELAAFDALFYVSDEPIYRYRIDYEEHIRPVVDPDGDGVLKSQDDCPSTYGYAEYGGCTKEIIERRRIAEREALERRRIAKKKRVRQRKKDDFRKFFLDFTIMQDDFSTITNGNGYAEFLEGYAGGISLGLPLVRQNIGNDGIGGLILDASFKTIDIYANVSSDKSLNIIDRTQINVGLSYGLMVKKYADFGFILQPRAGVSVYDILKTKQLVDIPTGDDIPEDLFYISNGRNEYYGLDIRLFNNKSKTNNWRIGLLLGAEWIRNATILPNSNYNYGLGINDTAFEYVDQNLQYRFGISILL